MTSWQYDAAGRVRKMIDPLSKETLYTFDADGRLATTTAPDGGVTTNTYDGAGRLATVTDPVGRVTTYRYDLAGRPSSWRTRPAASPSTSTTPRAGSRSRATAGPRDDQVFHDDDSNVTAVTDPLNHTTHYDFDLADRLFKVTDAANGITSYSHDLNGQLTTTTNPENETITSTYDPPVACRSVTDGLGHATTYTFDDAGRPTATTDALPVGRHDDDLRPGGRVATP